MHVLLQFAKDSAHTALVSYGLIALASVVFPSLGSPSQTWIVAPILFAIQFALKLIFSRDENGKLRSMS
jgi:hypothetical protein